MRKRHAADDLNRLGEKEEDKEKEKEKDKEKEEEGRRRRCLRLWGLGPSAEVKKIINSCVQFVHYMSTVTRHEAHNKRHMLRSYSPIHVRLLL